MKFSFRQKLPIFLMGIALLFFGMIASGLYFTRDQGTIESLNHSKNSATLAQFYNLPLYFERNEGQTNHEVKYLTHGKGYVFYFTPQEMVMTLQRESNPAYNLKMHFVGSNAHTQLLGQDEQLCKSNYFIGNDPINWRTNIPNYAKVTYPNLYPGIDVVFYGNSQQLEYDICVSSGSDPKVARIQIDGAKNLFIDSEGNLRILTTDDQEVLMHKPFVYQNELDRKIEIESKFILLAKNQIGFEFGGYDSSKDLIIDPVLSYSTYLGGSAIDRGTAIAVDSGSNATVTGITSSLNFPTTVGAFQTALAGTANAFVSRLNSTGTALIFSTYLGGAGSDRGNGVAVDAAGNSYIAGQTTSANFPTTVGAFQTALAGGTDAFVTKLNPTGTALVYSTYLGGTSTDIGNGITIDGTLNAYVTGSTTSADFPVTGGVFQTALAGGTDAFVTKLNATGTALVYSTYLGGTATDVGASIAIDAGGNAYVAGSTSSSNFPVTGGAFQTTLAGTQNAFITKLNATATALTYSTYLGGASIDTGLGITLDSTTNAYVTGSTTSANFPVTVGAFQTTLSGSSDAYVAKLNSTGTSLTFSTYLGGTGTEVGRSIAIDSFLQPYVTGETTSTDFPVTSTAFQSTLAGAQNAFVTKFNSSGSALIFSSYLGGSASETGFGIALNSFGSAFLVGQTSSANFPTTVGAFQTTFGGSVDAFVSRVDIGTPTVTGLVPNFGPTTGGTVVVISGTNFTNVTAVNFGGTPAASFVINNDNQITATSPPGTGVVDVTVTSPGGTSPTTPADLFTYVIVPTTTTLSVSPNPSTFGQAVTLTATVSPSAATGTVNFFDGVNFIGSATLSGGTAVLVINNFSIGIHPLTAAYLGDSFFAPSVSAPVNLIVNQGVTTTTLVASPNPANLGDPVTLTATISSNLATGTVSFFDGPNFIGTGIVSNGTASIVVNNFTLGAHVLVAVYSGDGNFAGSVSQPVILIINPANVNPPAHLRGVQKATRFATQTDIVNVLTWRNPTSGNRPVLYKIFIDKALTKLIGTVRSDEKLRFADHNKKEGKTYTYYVVSVDQNGNSSVASRVTIRGSD